LSYLGEVSIGALTVSIPSFGGLIKTPPKGTLLPFIVLKTWAFEASLYSPASYPPSDYSQIR